MPNLGGFEVVGELPIDVLNQILQGAWDSNIIPHSTNVVVASTMFGPYAVAEGVVDIPRNGVHLVMDTGINGVKVTLASEIQGHIANPPIRARASSTCRRMSKSGFRSPCCRGRSTSPRCSAPFRGAMSART